MPVNREVKPSSTATGSHQSVLEIAHCAARWLSPGLIIAEVEKKEQQPYS